MLLSPQVGSFKNISIPLKILIKFQFTALMNPDHNIHVLFTSQVGFRNTSRLPFVDVLLSYKNVHLNFLNLTRYAQKTPLEDWIKKGDLFRSQFVNSHTSDVLRYLSLWKYGGTYLDLGNACCKFISKNLHDLINI